VSGLVAKVTSSKGALPPRDFAASAIVADAGCCALQVQVCIQQGIQRFDAMRCDVAVVL